MWNAADITFELDDCLTDDPDATLLVSTPVGTLISMAVATQEGRRLVLRDCHVQGADANIVGVANLLTIAQALMEKVDYKDSSLRERFEQLGRVRLIDPVPSGSPATFELEVPQNPKEWAKIRTIDAIFVLARRGVARLEAKQAIEKLLDERRIFVEIPTVEDGFAVISELASAGIAATQLETRQPRAATG